MIRKKILETVDHFQFQSYEVGEPLVKRQFFLHMGVPWHQSISVTELASRASRVMLYKVMSESKRCKGFVDFLSAEKGNN